MIHPAGKTRSEGSLLAFFLLVYAASWAIFVPVALTGGPTLNPLSALAVTLGAFTPSVVALALTWRAEGDAGVRRFLNLLFRWDVPARWYVLASLYMVTIKLAAAVVVRVATGGWPRFGTEPLILIPIAIAFSTPFQAGEEIGWRGYALPRLAKRFGLRMACLLLGVIWATWHLPLFFVRGTDTYAQSFVGYLLSVMALAVALGWFYARTRSLLPVLLLHSAVNNSKDIVPSIQPGTHDRFGLSASPVGWVTLGLLWAGALYFLIRMPPAVPGQDATSFGPDEGSR